MILKVIAALLFGVQVAMTLAIVLVYFQVRRALKTSAVTRRVGLLPFHVITIGCSYLILSASVSYGTLFTESEPGLLPFDVLGMALGVVALYAILSHKRRQQDAIAEPLRNLSRPK